MADSLSADEQRDRSSAPPTGHLEPQHRPASSEIARRRAARDLWVSRSHVAAAAAGALVLAATTFGVGLALGQRWADPAAATVPSLTDEVPRDELLRLLARIDGNASGASSALTFPDALRGQGTPPLAPVDVAGVETHVPSAPLAMPADAPPTSGFTVVVARLPTEPAARELRLALASAGMDAWIGPTLVDGVATWRVAVGHQATRADADAAALLLASAGTPEVEELLPPPPAPEPPPAPVEEPLLEPLPTP